MVDDRFIELVQRELDGVLSGSEEEELRRYLDSAGDARQYREELRAAVQHVAALPVVAPPPQLKSEILRAVRRRGAAQPIRSSLRTRLARAFESRVAFNYVYAFSAGVILGVALYGLVARLEQPVPSASDVSGALLPRAVTGTSVLTEELQIDTLGMTALIRVREMDGMHLADLTLRSGSPVRAVVDFNAGALCLSGFSQTRQSPETIRVGDSRIEIGTTGPNDLAFLFEARSPGQPLPPISVTLLSSAGTVQRSVNLSRPQ
jgi:hypothetical protein